MRGKTTLFLVVLTAIAGGFIAFGPVATPVAGGQEAGTYVGSDSCKMCHAEAHQTWVEQKHSTALASLTEEQIASGKDDWGRACISCHVTGWGKENGFVSLEKSAILKNVGCEACHGPAKAHMQAMMAHAMSGEEEPPADKKIGMGNNCSECHNPHISYKKKYGGE